MSEPTHDPRVTLRRVLADGVRAELTRRGGTQRGLARDVGTAPVHLSQILNGARVGSVAMWSRLLDALGLEVVVKRRRGGTP